MKQHLQVAEKLLFRALIQTADATLHFGPKLWICAVVEASLDSTGQKCKLAAIHADIKKCIA